MKYAEINQKVNTNMKLNKRKVISQSQFINNLKLLKSQLKTSIKYSKTNKFSQFKNWLIKHIIKYKINYLIKIHSKDKKMI